jgi:predicted RNA-binding Zn-ribbon protein involved in translation (DUF1610 family)
MSAGADLQAQRKRVPKICPGCGEIVLMLTVQHACSARCRTRAHRAIKKGERA